MTIESFVHRPNRVEVVQYTGDNFEEVNDWALNYMPNAILARYQKRGETIIEFYARIGGRFRWVPITPGTFVVREGSTFEAVSPEEFSNRFVSASSSYGRSLRLAGEVTSPDTDEYSLHVPNQPSILGRDATRHQVHVSENGQTSFHHSNFCEANAGFSPSCRYFRWWQEVEQSGLPALPGWYALRRNPHSQIEVVQVAALG